MAGSVPEKSVPGARHRAGVGEFLSRQGLPIALIAVVAAFSFLSPYFLTLKNILNIALALAITLMLSAGETAAIICGLTDLSIASTLAFSSVLTAILLQAHWHFLLAIAAALASGILIGYINGFVTTKLRVNPLITTLGTMATFRGLAFIISDGKSIGVDNAGFESIGKDSLLGIPIPFIAAFVICLLVSFVLSSTVFGRRLRAVGGNSEVADLFGINSNRIKISAFIICGITAAIAGVFTTARMKSGAPIAALGQELPVITAVILGGVSISGGVGNIWGTVLGVLFLSILSNGFTLTYVSSFWQQVVRGIILIGAVSLDIMRREKRRN